MLKILTSKLYFSGTRRGGSSSIFDGFLPWKTINVCTAYDMVHFAVLKFREYFIWRFYSEFTFISSFKDVP